MRRWIPIFALASATLACRDIPTSAGEGAETTGGQEPGQSEPAQIPFAAGSRLRPVVLQAEGGSGELVRWYDTELLHDCEFQIAGDGVLRCLPTVRGTTGTSGGVFGDAACTQRVAISSCPTDDTWASGHVAAPDLCAPQIEVRPVIDAWSMAPAYAWSDGECVDIGEQYLAPVGPAEDPELFVAATDELEPGEGRIRGLRRVAEDDSWSYALVRDTDLGATVTPGDTHDGVRRWLPLEAWVTDAFADAACTEPLGTVLDACPPAAVSHVHHRDFEDCSQRYALFESGAEIESSAYGYPDSGTDCTELTEGHSTYYPVNAPASDDDFEPALPVTLVGGQLEAVYRAPLEQSAALAFEGFVDVVHGVECRPGLDIDGQLRCLPETASSVTDLYLDDACATEPLAAVHECDSPPPTHVIELLEHTGCEPVRWEVRTVGDAVPVGAMLYEREYGGNCEPLGPAIEGYFETSVADPSPWAALAEVTL